MLSRTLLVLAVVVVVIGISATSAVTVTGPASVEYGQLFKLQFALDQTTANQQVLTIVPSFNPPLSDLSFDEVFNLYDENITGPSAEEYQCTHSGSPIGFAKPLGNDDIKVTIFRRLAADDLVICPFRLRHNTDYVGSVTLTVGDSGSTIEIKPTQTTPTISAELRANDRTIGVAGKDIKIPDALQQYDISKFVLKYSNLPKNYMAPISFSILSVDAITLPSEVSSPSAEQALEDLKLASSDLLMTATTAFMRYGFIQTDAKCSNDVRLVYIEENPGDSPLFLLTGENPAAGECQLPFSRTALGLVGIASGSDRLAEYFDIAPLLQKAVDVKVHLGPWSASANAGKPLFPQIEQTGVTVNKDDPNQLDLTVNTFISQENPEFQISSIGGLTNSIISLIKGDYGSLYELATGKGSAAMTTQGIFDWIPKLAEKTKLTIGAGWAAIKLKIPTTGGDAIDPIYIDMTLAGRKIQVVYQPVAEFAGDLDVSSVTNTQMKFTMKFHNKNSILGLDDILPLFKPTASTQVEYAIAPTMVEIFGADGVYSTNHEIRHPDHPVPTCTVSHPDLKIKTHRWNPDKTLDAFLSSYLVVSGTTLVQDEWTMDCVQELNPGAKVIFPSHEKTTIGMNFQVYNRFLHDIWFPEDERWVSLSDAPFMNWNQGELNELSTIYLDVHYAPGIKDDATFNTFLTGLISYLKLGSTGNNINPFATITPENIAYPVDSRINQKVYSSHRAGLTMNLFDNKYLESWSNPGAHLTLAITAPSGITFSQTDADNWTFDGQFNSDYRITNMGFGAVSIYKNTPAKFVNPTIDSDASAMTLASGIGAPCYSSYQCPSSICYNSVCTESIVMPGPVRATLWEDLRFDVPYFNFHNNSVASIGSMMTIAAVVIALLF